MKELVQINGVDHRNHVFLYDKYKDYTSTPLFECLYNELYVNHEAKIITHKGEMYSVEQCFDLVCYHYPWIKTVAGTNFIYHHGKWIETSKTLLKLKKTETTRSIVANERKRLYDVTVCSHHRSTLSKIWQDSILSSLSYDETVSELNMLIDGIERMKELIHEKI